MGMKQTVLNGLKTKSYCWLISKVKIKVFKWSTNSNLPSFYNLEPEAYVY